MAMPVPPLRGAPVADPDPAPPGRAARDGPRVGGDPAHPSSRWTSGCASDRTVQDYAPVPRFL